MNRLLHLAGCLAAALALVSCGSGAGDDEVNVAFIGSTTELFEPGFRLAAAGQHIRSATAEGLVSLNQSGEVVPALAERWIVTEDGLSYIFRLRNTNWADGTPLTSNSVRDALRRNIREVRGTSLGLDLVKISEIRAMTGRVVEIRLDGPMPEFLQLLAQPELGLRRNRQGTGPMTLTRERDIAVLDPLPPELRGLPIDEEWESTVRTVRVQALPAEQAVAAFDNRAVDAVFNGTLASLPLADTGALSRGTVRLDAALGLLGLQVVSERGLLATAAGREAIALAIDRQSLLQPFNIGGWIPTNRVVAPGLPGDPKIIGERWDGLSLEQRQAEAARRVAAAIGSQPSARNLKIALPPGPGSDLLFRELSDDLAAVGLVLDRASNSASADLVLVDRLARYADARWFLNQFHCSLDRGLCSPEADEAVRRAVQAPDQSQTAALMAEAEARMTAANVYIPIGAPIRWSLVRGGVDGFSENNWGLHPLFPLALRPT